MTTETTTQLEALLTADGTTLPERLDHWAQATPQAICLYDEIGRAHV